MSNDIVPVPPEYILTTEENLWLEFRAEKGQTIYHGGDAEYTETIPSELPSIYTDADYDGLMYGRAGNFAAVVNDYLNSYAVFKQYCAARLSECGGYIITPARRDNIRAKVSDLCARIVKVLPNISPEDGASRLGASGFFNSGFGSYTLNVERVRATVFPDNGIWRYTVEIVPLDEDLFTGDFEFLFSTAVSTFISYQMGQAAQAAIQSGNVAAQYGLAAVQASRAGVSGDFNDILDGFAQSALKTWANAPDSVDTSGGVIDTSTIQNGADQMPLLDAQDFSGGYLDYDQVFDPVNYSSGEGFIVSSDAQNVDFGFGGVAPDPAIHYTWGDQLIDPAPVSDGFNVTYGATPENTTSAFGTTNYPMETQGKSSFSLGTVKSAVQTTKSVIDTGRQIARIVSGGGAKYSANTPPFVAPGSVSSGLGTQKESNITAKYRGQLAPGGQAIASSHPSGLVVGVLAIAGAYLLFRKG
jgi:hypothetical protein